jgi:hypothetical protein
MLIPFLVSTIFVISIIYLCFVKPNAGRAFLGFFFLAMSLGINGYFTIGNPAAYLDYAEGALIPLYGQMMTTVVSISPVAFGVLLMIFEITMGLLLLQKKNLVRIGLVGITLFLIGMAPLSWLQLPWLGLIIAIYFLFRKEFNQPIFKMILDRLKRRKLDA